MFLISSELSKLQKKIVFIQKRSTFKQTFFLFALEALTEMKIIIYFLFLFLFLSLSLSLSLSLLLSLALSLSYSHSLSA